MTKEELQTENVELKKQAEGLDGVIKNMAENLESQKKQAEAEKSQLTHQLNAEKKVVEGLQKEVLELGNKRANDFEHLKDMIAVGIKQEKGFFVVHSLKTPIEGEGSTMAEAFRSFLQKCRVKYIEQMQLSRVEKDELGVHIPVKWVEENFNNGEWLKLPEEEVK